MDMTDMDGEGMGAYRPTGLADALRPSLHFADDDERGWIEDLDSYIPDDDEFLASGLLGDPLGESSYELLYRILPGVRDDMIEVVGYRGAPEFVDVPDRWGGMLVVGIADHAFCGCPTIKSLTVAENIDYIGAGAFEECDMLRSVALAGRAAMIEDRAFANCGQLEQVDVTGYIEEVGDYAFLGCASLARADWLVDVDEVGKGAFWGCSSLSGVSLKEWPVDLIARMGAPAFYDHVFAGCTSLGSDCMPSVIWYDLGESAFEGCTSVEEVDIEATGYSSIGRRAFAGCTSLRTATLRGDMPIIGSEAFAGCTALEHVVLPDTVERIEPGAFKDCSSLALVEVALYNPYWDDEPRLIPLSRSAIVVHEDAFEGCSKLNS